VEGSLEALPDWARALLEQARVAHLGLLDDRSLPRVLPVTFALFGGAVWSAVDRKPKADPAREPARLAHLRRRPEVALTVDRYEDDWERLAWVQVLGRASVLPASEGRAALGALAAKYEQYRADPPPGPLIRIEPRRALWWKAR
jgi:PPOX class probable F420-dependent enzyme